MSWEGCGVVGREKGDNGNKVYFSVFGLYSMASALP